MTDWQAALVCVCHACFLVILAIQDVLATPLTMEQNRSANADMLLSILSHAASFVCMLFRRIPNFSVFSRLATSVVFRTRITAIAGCCKLARKGHEKDFVGGPCTLHRVRTPYTRHCLLVFSTVVNYNYSCVSFWHKHSLCHIFLNYAATL